LKYALIVVSALCCGLIGYVIAGDGASEAEWRSERAAAAVDAFKSSRKTSARKARQHGFIAGRTAGARGGDRAGTKRGGADGEEDAGSQLAEAEAEAELTYTEELPNGDPGYALPPEERSVGCVGISAETGECVGD
jgi:hypothetical protein